MTTSIHWARISRVVFSVSQLRPQEITGGVPNPVAGRLLIKGNRIIIESGAQFPIAGVVWEDILPHDDIYELYCFRNGVTVGIRGVEHRGTRQLTDEEMNKALYGEILWSGAYCRIASTTREEYKANGGMIDVGASKPDSNRKLSWLEVARDLYQDAWGKDRNELIIVWAKMSL